MVQGLPGRITQLSLGRLPTSTRNNQRSRAQPGTVTGNNGAVCQLVETKSSAGITASSRTLK